MTDPLSMPMKLPPKEAVAFFRQKGYRIGFDYRDVERAEHQASFTVAKAMQHDLLADIRTHLDQALTDGTTLKTFRDSLRPNLVKRGWWGKAMMTDPQTGEEKLVQLGSPRRLKVIYDTNLRTAHAEGQWERIQATKASQPYLMYDHTPSAHERPQHVAWDGLVLPADDPWWLNHYPIKEYGCKCGVIQMGPRQLERYGLTVGKAPEEKYYTYTNKRTGEVLQVPEGVHPSFNYPPGGRQANLSEYLVSRIERLQPDLRPAAIRALGKEALGLWLDNPVGNWPVGVLSAQYVADMAVKTDVVRLSAETMKKQARRHPDLTVEHYGRIQDALEKGEAVFEADKKIIFLLDEPGGVVAVVKATQVGDAVFLTSLRRLSGEAARKDREVARIRANKAKK